MTDRLSVELTGGDLLAKIGYLPLEESTLAVSSQSDMFPIRTEVVMPRSWHKRGWGPRAVLFGLLATVISIGLAATVVVWGRERMRRP